MLRINTSFFLSLCSLGCLPLALVAVACSGDDEPATGDDSVAGTSSNAAGGGDGATSGTKSTGAATGSGDASNGGDETVGAAGAGTLALAPVELGTAENYAIVAKSAVSNVPTSKVTGDIGLSPAAGSYVTGFSLTRAGVSWTSKQVVGDVFAADNDEPTPTLLTTAVSDMQTAYTDAAGRKSPDFMNLGAGEIGGLTLVPGLYKWTSSVTIPSDVTLEGAANDVWIFQVSGDLELASAQAVLLSGGAEPANIFWQVAGSVDLGTTSHAEGIILCKTAITLDTGASINGRLLAQTAVNIGGSTVTAP
jgi:ice-binding like protein